MELFEKVIVTLLILAVALVGYTIVIGIALTATLNVGSAILVTMLVVCITMMLVSGLKMVFSNSKY